MGPMELDPSIRTYYDRGKEADRLSGGFPSGPLELARTKEILERHLPPPPADVLDVGGGPGVYAAWLADRGYRVHLIDPVPLHVEQAAAAHGEVTAEVGDARALRGADGSADAVLLLGPMYHLVERDDRILALREAARVLRPGGLMFAAAISRFAALMDLLVRLDRLHEPEIATMVERSVTTGVFEGPGEAELFTTSYFHLPRELAAEVTAAGFAAPDLLQIEGPGFLVPDFENRWADENRREAMLQAARWVENEPEMLAASSHLMAVARTPA
ncbi:MAG: methyltransferase domain-containing protein [Actinobacteria bacterium]|jgi:SAM-dependent methyltransferase|nr:methyltransferase domain-containing protein [Actinomycetota bacterium]